MAFFDDFKIEPIVELVDIENRPVTARSRQATDSATTYSGDGTKNPTDKPAPAPNRAAFRAQAVPIRE